MVTLDRWRAFVTTPKTLTFPRLELIGRDHAPSIVVGTGEVQMASPTDFTFTLTGTPADVGYAFAEINRQRDNPYDGLARLRLIGVDAEGVNWAGGYTIPRVDTSQTAWTFTGEIDSLVTDDKSSTVSRQASTELIFLLRVGDPMTIALARFVRTNQPAGKFRREHVMQILGSQIRFAYEISSGTLSVTASHSPELPATYTENWLGEPLRILFGQLIYPRLVARNFGDGNSSVWVRPSPVLVRGARWAGLLGPDDLIQDDSAFWSLYAKLLSLIARARGKDKCPNFEPHKITQLYQEVIQAARGTRWVWALTFASAIEAIAKMLIPKDAKPTQTAAKAIGALVKRIDAVPGDAQLKRIAINAVNRTSKITTIRVMRKLQATGVITKAQLSAWETTRNAVMHGSLVSPYSNEEDDARLLALAAMMHVLTRELIRQ